MSQTLKTQMAIGLGLIVLMILWGFNLPAKSVGFLISGLFIGYILTRSRFGFAGGVKRPYMTGDTSLNEALFFMFTITAVVVAAIHWHAADGGAVLASLAKEGDKVIPGSQSVRPLDLGVMIGGFLFGGGMIIAGGCASGTLTDLGEGAVRSLIALVFYIIGSPIGHWMRVVYGKSENKIVNVSMYFPNSFGYVGSVALTAALFLVLFYIVKGYSYKRKQAGTYIKPGYEDIEKELDYDNAPFFSYATYHRFFIKRWSFMTGGILLALMFIFVLVSTGKTWGVTSAFTTWGVALFSRFGVDFAAIGGFDKEIKEAANLLAHNGTIRNIGIILGASISFLLAGRFTIDRDFKAKDAAWYALGGLLMGIGARFARGCNVGALYSAITAFSLHGWGFLVFMTLGAIVFLKLSEGKLNIVPKRNV